MKILVSILSALTLTTTVSISSIPMSFTKTVKKHKIKDQRDNESDNKDSVSLQEEKKTD